MTEETSPLLQWIPVNRAIGSLEQPFEANPEEQKQIENITRICFAYLGHHLI
jgi:hypothetical protein